MMVPEVPGHDPGVSIDVWGRQATAESISLWLDTHDRLMGTRRHYQAIAAAVYGDPAAALRAIEAAMPPLDGLDGTDRAATDAAKERIGTVAKVIGDTPARFGQMKGEEPRGAIARLAPAFFADEARQAAIANTRSLSIIAARYYGERYSMAADRHRSIGDQLARDRKTIPKLSEGVAAFLEDLQGMLAAGALDEKLRHDAADLWSHPNSRDAVEAITAYARAVRNRLGAATPKTYLDAATRWASLYAGRNGFGPPHVANLRQALRASKQAERVVSAVEGIV